MNKNERRIKYYSKYDGSNLLQTERVQKIFADFDSSKPLDINDYIELYNIDLFFQNKVIDVYYNKNEIQKLDIKYHDTQKAMCKYFNSLDIHTLSKIYKDIERKYVSDIWEIISKFKIYEKFDEIDFKNFINKNDVSPDLLLKENKIVEKFDELLSDLYRNDARLAELLVKEFIELKDEINRDRFYFPKEIDINTIVGNYIESENPNLNYLNAINYFGKQIDGLDSRVCLNAKKKSEEISSNLLNQGNSISYGAVVEFCNDDNINMDKIVKDNNTIYKYNIDFLFRDSNVETLLIDNFAYVFDFLDQQSRFNHSHHISRSGVFERMIGIHSKKEYIINLDFNISNSVAHYQMAGYTFQLKKKNICIESLINDYFTKYLPKKFGINDFVFNPSTENDSNLKKCRNLSIEIDSLLRQYKSFVEEGKINFELISYDSTPVLFNDIPSLVSNKYVYINNEKCIKAANLLFYDQSMLLYSYKENISYNNFIERTIKSNLKIEDIEEYSEESVKWLLHEKLCYIDDKQNIKCDDMCLAIWQLFDKEVISYHEYKDKNSLDKLIDMEYCSFGDQTLLSKPENEYLCFLLNKKEYFNGLDLRNKYLHGSKTTDEKVNMNDYFVLLRVLVLIILKINNDLEMDFNLK